MFELKRKSYKPFAFDYPIRIWVGGCCIACVMYAHTNQQPKQNDMRPVGCSYTVINSTKISGFYLKGFSCNADELLELMVDLMEIKNFKFCN